MAEIRLNVNPRFSLDVDAATLGLLEKFATFWRGQHPSERNPDVDQIGDFLRSALCKLQDYDEVTRGIRMASTTASLEPEEKPGLCIEPPVEEALPGPPQAMGPPPVPEAPLQEGVIDPSPPLIPEPEARPPIDFDPPSPGGPMPGPSFRDDPPSPPPDGPSPAGPAPGAPPLPEEPKF